MAARKRPKTTPPADAAGERLERYRAKRDFAVTPEPSGGAPPAADGHRFVVQRHRARRLHYDLRLEAAGVLVSWAVPKGPTLDPDVRRMAVHVEDHPLDYFDFEGVIPAGEYGGGDVVVWDWGTWSIAEADDPLAAIDAGNLHFDLDGEKLRGRFVLVRDRGGDGPGLAAAQEARRGGRGRLGPRGPSPVGQVGPDERRGHATRRRRAGRARPAGRHRPRTSWPPSTPSARAGSGSSASTP